VPDHLADVERARHPVDERHHVDAEGVLQLRVLVQVVEDDLRDRVTLEDDHQPLPGARAGLVLHVGDAADLAVAHQIRDLFGERVPVDLVGQLGDDELLAPAAVLLDLDDRAHADGSTPSAQPLVDAVPPDDKGARGEVRTLDALD
jgi:hypothetical protein